MKQRITFDFHDKDDYYLDNLEDITIPSINNVDKEY